jgi:hypothetical protein
MYIVTFTLGGGKVVLQRPSTSSPKVCSDLAAVIKIVLALRMSSILLGPIGPRSAGEGGARGLPEKELKQTVTTKVYVHFATDSLLWIADESWKYC